MSTPKYEWREVAKVSFDYLKDKNLAELPAIFETLKLEHGDDARIEVGSYHISNSTLRSEGYVEPTIVPYLKVMKYVQVKTREEKWAEYEAMFAKKAEQAKETRVVRAKKMIAKIRAAKAKN